MLILASMRPEALRLLEDIRHADVFIFEATALLSLAAHLENRLEPFWRVTLDRRAPGLEGHGP